MQGINLDQPFFVTPPTMWNGGNNVYMEDGVATRIRGMAPVYSPPLTKPWHIAFSRIAGESNWIYAGPDDVAQFDGTSHTLIGALDWPVSASPNDISSCILNGLPIINARGVAPYYWNRNPLSLIQHLPGTIAGERYDFVRAFKYNLFGFGINDGVNSFPDAFRWSASADAGNIPLTWTPANNNDAGDGLLAAQDGEIIDAIAYRDQLLAFKRNATYAISFVGGRFIYAIRLLSEVNGILCRYGVCNAGDVLYMLTDGDVVKSDTLNYTSALTRQMRRYLFDNIDPIHYDKSFLIADNAARNVWVCFPTLGNSTCNKAIVISIDDGAATKRDLPGALAGSFGLTGGAAEVDWDGDAAAWDSATEAWDEEVSSSATYVIVFACPDRVNSEWIVRGEIGYTYMGADVDCNIARYQMDMDDPQRSKTLYRVRPFIEAVGNIELYCRVGVQDNLNESIFWEPWQVASFPGTDDFDFNTAGRYLSVEFYSTTPAKWSLAGFNAEYRLGGKY